MKLLRDESFGPVVGIAHAWNGEHRSNSPMSQSSERDPLACSWPKCCGDAVVIERRDRAYVGGRVRAGVLEEVTVDLMRRLDLGARLPARA